MTQPEDPTADDVLRSVGRNLLLFQQVERMFKFLLSHARAHGFAATLAQDQQQRSLRVHRQTLGQLIVQYTEELGAGARPPDVPENPSTVWFSFAFELEAHPDFSSIQEDNLACLLRERNDLVHHFAANSDLDSAAGRAAALSDLERQRQLIASVREPLARIVRDLELTARATSEYFASPEFRQVMESAWAAPSPLVALLRDIAVSEGGADGWTPLGTAGRLLRQRSPQELDALFERYGHRTLRGFVQACECFELRDEVTARGGVRVVYRHKA